VRKSKEVFAMEEHMTETSQRKLSTKDMAAAAERDEARDKAQSPGAAEGSADFNSRTVGAGDGEQLSPLLSPDETGEFPFALEFDSDRFRR
jgi:hypothetical protein